MSRPGKSSRPPCIRVSAALFALALAYALSLAARNGLADLYAEPAKNFLQEKRDADLALTDTEWQAIHANLRRALGLEPHNPVTLTELGRLHRIQLESDTLDRTAIERHGKLAIDYYEQAARLRPAWPWVWSNLALVRYELYQEASDAYHRALIRAARFGPWEDHVQSLVVELGVDTWASLSPGAQLAALVTIDRALERQPAALDAIVDSGAGWQELCRAAAPVAMVSPPDGKADELRRLQWHCAERGLN